MASTISAGTTSGTAINISGDTSGALALQTNNGTTAVTITTAQNVGIGTTNPASWGGLYKGLDINTYGQFAASTGGAVWLGNNFYYDGSNYVYKNSAPVSGYLQSSGGHNWYVVASGTAGNTFSFSTPAVQITSDGALLVNTTSPQNTPLIQANGDTSTYNMVVLKDTGTTYSSGNRYCLFLNSSAALAGSIYHSASTTVNFNTTSDARLKTDKGIATDISVIDNTVIHDFEWKADNRIDRGVFAQEAYEVKPSAVGVGTDELTEDGSLANPWGVDYSKYVPDLIVYCQQLKKSIQELKAEFDAYKASHP